MLATFHVRPLLVDQILAGQSQDPRMIKLKEEIEKGKKAEFQIRDDGMIVKGQRMCVLDFEITLLVEWDEERDRKFRLQMPNLSAGEGRASEAHGGRNSYSLFQYGNGRRSLWIL